jgi:metallo-beta-lactamase family protein
VKLSFHGADQDVTGSCHLVEAAGRKILIDCGMMQGSRELDEDNAAAFGFDPKSIDLVLLTHAHLDHCGRLPLLVKQGFKGEIVATSATRDLARLVILDAAHLQEEEARQRSSVASRRHGGSKPVPPLYGLVDAMNCLGRFNRAAEYGKPIAVVPGIQATYFDAGHILGSASIYLEIAENGKTKTLLFSGDIGNAGRPLLGPPTTPARADTVVMESTYGDRNHRPNAQSIEELWQAVIDTLNRGGNLVIPTFALERAQEILYYLRQGIETSRLRAAIQVFLDSPMAISAVDIFKQHPESLKSDIAALIAAGTDPFAVPGLHITRDRASSIAINAVKGGAVIMAGSGMATGGRVRHHLLHNLWRPESSIVFVGYAAAGTPARRIIDGAKTIRLFDQDVAVRAKIYTLGGFSAHADQSELIAWHDRIQGKTTTFIVHGEKATMDVLAPLLHNTKVEIPALHSVYEL